MAHARRPARQAAPRTASARLPRHASAPPPTAPSRPQEAPRRLRILLVEDEVAVRTVVTHQLSSEGHTVDSASNGREGLEKFMSGWFDLVITDRAMPEMGGDQLAAATGHDQRVDRPLALADHAGRQLHS